MCPTLHVGDPFSPVPPQQPFDNFRTSLSCPIVKIDSDISRNVLTEFVGNLKMLKGSIATSSNPLGLASARQINYLTALSQELVYNMANQK